MYCGAERDEDDEAYCCPEAERDDDDFWADKELDARRDR